MVYPTNALIIVNRDIFKTLNFIRFCVAPNLKNLDLWFRILAGYIIDYLSCNLGKKNNVNLMSKDNNVYQKLLSCLF
jgi:hypothetical protein